MINHQSRPSYAQPEAWKRGFWRPFRSLFCQKVLQNADNSSFLSTLDGIVLVRGSRPSESCFGVPKHWKRGQKWPLFGVPPFKTHHKPRIRQILDQKSTILVQKVKIPQGLVRNDQILVGIPIWKLPEVFEKGSKNGPPPPKMGLGGQKLRFCLQIHSKTRVFWIFSLQPIQNRYGPPIVYSKCYRHSYKACLIAIATLWSIANAIDIATRHAL